ncbi:SNF2-related [Macleaya cordata]|uniref:SNF2-related n=1 Tax=Macleaya cordata TaxID=56857 RepID=A0A200R5T0_MACCD|nr:SNF2-related [Macleaya cordata]
MAKVTRSGRILKDNDGNSSKRRQVGGKGVTSGSTTTDTSVLRRSTRETSSKKQRTSSPSSTRKSERIEKHMPQTPPTKRKSERVVNQKMPSSLRRSERGLSLSGSKKSEKGSSSLETQNKKDKREKSEKQLKLNSKDRKRNAKKGLKSDWPSARRYRALFKPQRGKVKESDIGEKLEVHGDLSQGDSGNGGASGSMEVEHGGHCCESKGEEIREEVLGEGCERDIEGSSSHMRDPAERTSRHQREIELPSRKRKRCLEEAYKTKNGDNSPVSAHGDSSPQSSHHGDAVIAKEAIGDADKLQMDCSAREDLLEPELMESPSEGRSFPGGRKLERTEKVGSKRKRLGMDSNSATMEDGEEICTSTADAVSSSQSGSKNSNFIEGCAVCSKRRRVHCDTENHDVCCCSSKRNLDLSSTSSQEDEGELEARVCRGLTEECCNSDQLKDSPPDTQLGSDNNVCVICKIGGTLLCCEGEGCKKSYHLDCLDPPLKDVPPGVWHCLCCVKKKMESGVHSVSGGVESILDAKEVELSDSEGTRKQYLVKYKGLAHVHNRWIPESQLLLEAPMLVSKFKKNQGVRWKSEWAVPHRLLLKRLLMSQKQRDKYLGGHHSDFSNCYYEWFVKWSGLGYEHATWELENEPFLRSPEAMILIRDYESRREKAKIASDPTRADKVLHERRSSFFKLLELPGQCQLGFDNNHLCFVNKLRECWHKGQNAVVMEDQERVIKVILFILALQSIVCRPFLIISTSSALSAWEAEFLRLAPSVNVVVYGGSRDVRKNIRMLEFYEEGGCTMFQVLLSPPDALVEDLEVLKCLGWEAIIVDECQRSRVSKHFEDIKMLTTDFKLLLVSGPIKDSMVEYLNLLSFIDSGSDGNGIDNVKIDSNDNIDKLKERFTRFVASERKSDSSKFVEYRVPVRLSNVQLEQYCATLLSNSTLLRSCSKSDTVEALRDILISIRKCCDHPYLVDPSLQGLLTKGHSEVEYLDVGVNASGKLQVLDKTLSEIKRRGLRVLILFQSISGSGRISIGDFLDDFLRQRFGPDSYERVDSGLLTSKKQAAMNKFNDKERGRFVFLIENRACLPSIRLSSVDIVILYDSDWNPLNDLRALQRITIDSQYEQLKVFRLYSSCSLEEKVLLLAKQDMTLDSNVHNINRTTTHMLLKWGASYLFKELDEFHGSTPSSGSTISSEQSLLNVVQELLALLSQDAGSTNTNDSSIVLKVKQTGGTYSKDISLPGELEMLSSDEELPHVFWTKLLDRRSPHWRYLSAPSQRVRKKVQYFDESPKKMEVDNDDVIKKRKKGFNNTIDPKSHKPLQEEKRKEVGVNKEGASGPPAGNGSQFLPSSTAQTDSLRYRNVNDISDVPEAHMVESEERRKLRDSQKNLHIFLKPEMSKLCEILRLPEDVKELTGEFLEYIMNNHLVNKDPETILQAFQISLCWTAASLLKHKICHKETLALAKQHLNFECNVEEAESVYEALRKTLKKIFSRRAKNVMESNRGENPARTTDDAKHHLHVRDQSTVSDQQELEEGEIRESPQSRHCSDQHVSAKQQGTDFEKVNGSPNNEISKSITQVKRIHSKRIRKLSTKLMEERDKFLKKSEEFEKKANAQINKEYSYESAIIRLTHSQKSVRVEKLNLVTRDFNRKRDELKYRMEMEKKKLESMQQAAMNEEKRLKLHWLREAKSGRPVASFFMLPLAYSGFRFEDMDPSEQGGVSDVPKKATSISGTSSGEQISDRTGLLRPGEMGVTEARITVRHEPVEGTMPTEPPDFVVQSTFQSSEQQSNHDDFVLPPAVQVQLPPPTDPPSDPLPSNQSSDPDVSVLPPAEQLQLPPPTDLPSELLPSNQFFNHDISVLPPAVQLQLPPPTDPPSEPRSSSQSSNPDISVLPPAEQLQLPPPTDPPSEPLPSNQFSNHDISVLPPAVQLQLPPPTDPPSNPLPSNQSFNHDVSVLSPALQLQLPPPTDQPSDPLPSNQSSNHDSSVLPPAVQLQLPAPTDPSSEPLLSNQSSIHDVSVLSPALQLQLPPPTYQPTEPLPSNQSSNHDASVLPLAVQLQLPAPTDPSSDPLPSNQSNHFNNDDSVLLPAVQLQLPPTADPPSEHNQPDAPACTVIEHGGGNSEGQNSSEQSLVPTQPRVEDQAELVNNSAPQLDAQLEYDIQLRHTTSQQAEVPTLPPPAEDHTELLSHNAILQPDTMFQLPMSMDRSLGGSGSHVSDNRSSGVVPDSSNRPLQTAPVTSRMSQPLLHHDPLSNELARIRKEEDQVVKFHEDLKMRINSDFEKEMEEIRQKYNQLRQDADAALAQKKKVLEGNFNKVFMNRMLAEVFRFKCSDTRAAGPLGSQQVARPGFVQQQQLFQSSSQQSAQRPPPVPAAGGPTAAPAASPPPIQVVHHSAALFSSNSTVVRPHFGVVGPTTVNYQVGGGGGELRAPAPHLQPFRPSSAPMPSQQPLSNPAAASFVGPHLTSPLVSSYQTGTLSRTHQSESAGTSLSRTHQSESAGVSRNTSQIFEMMMRDFDNGVGGANSPNLLSPVATFDPSDLFEPRMPGSLWPPPAPTGHPTDVVCLSDDD